MIFFDKIIDYFNPSKNPDIASGNKNLSVYLPTLWLIGKTGSGKSRLIQAVTGDSQVEIGEGFRPCTMSSKIYDFPSDKPLLRFLDTRGLAEADYDASKDIAECESCTNALIVVMKAEEPEQSSVIDALKKIRKSGAIRQILLVHTGTRLIARDFERRQSIAHNQSQVESAWKKDVDSVVVDFELEDGSAIGIAELNSKLAELLPIISLLGAKKELSSIEEKNFAKVRNEVLWYASATGGSDAIPVVGFVSVPLIQAKMLHSLANQYGVKWDRFAIAEFIGALGTGFSIQYTSKLGIRQLVKLVPVYGQTAGSATAAVVSFCSTYAIGRVACRYMHYKSKGEPIPEGELRDMYHSVFRDIKKVRKREADS